MDLLLINPPYNYGKGNKWRGIAGNMPSLGLALIAAYAREKGYSVKILDCFAEKIGIEEIDEHLPKEEIRFIGITTFTSYIKKAYKLAERIRPLHKESKIVFGGVHATFMPDEVLAFDYIDLVVRAEGEEPMLELLNGVPYNEIKNLSYKEDGKIIHNDVRPIIKDLNSYPMPAYDMLPMEKYKAPLGSYRRKPVMNLVTSRGCPGLCTYCSGGFLGSRIRFKTADKIFDEVKYLMENYGIKEITIIDDTFTLFKRRVKEFCELLKKNNVDLSWSCYARIDNVDRELLETMYDAGMHHIGYGIESGSDEILKNIKKGVTVADAVRVVEMTKQVGIEVRCAYMFGNQGETEDTMKQTMRLAKQLNTDFALFNISTPFPGTELFNWGKENGYINTYDWDDYDVSKVILELPTVSNESIMRFYKKSYKEYYLRPRLIWQRIKRIKNFSDLWQNLKAVWAVIKGL